MQSSRDITRLIEIMAALRTPDTGCPWDLQQNFATIAPYTLEEAYEVADAIARGKMPSPAHANIKRDTASSIAGRSLASATAAAETMTTVQKRGSR